MEVKRFNKEQLLTLNQLVQALPIGQRKSYLEDLGALWEHLSTSVDYFVDERDYNIYSIVRIGHQEWLGENLRYKGVRYYENPANLNLFYGCLYDWTAMVDVAPHGWHVASDEDWKELERTLGMSENDVNYKGYRGEIGGALIVREEKVDNDSNSSGFGALPAGFYGASNFHNLAYNATFWSPIRDVNGFILPWHRDLLHYSREVGRRNCDKSYAFSCRCLKDRFFDESKNT